MDYTTVVTDSMPDVTNLEGPGEGDGPDLIGFSLDVNFVNFNSPTNITNLTNNATLGIHTGESHSLSTILGGQSIRTLSWATQLDHRFTLTFLTQDDARAYFNTGGEFRITPTITDASATAQNQAWIDLFATNQFAFTGTDYFNLTDAAVDTTTKIFSVSPGAGAYSTPPDGPIEWYIQASTDTIVDVTGRGGKGLKITIRVVFFDAHVGVGGGPDLVDGNFIITTESFRSDLIFMKDDPDYDIVIETVGFGAPFSYELRGS